MYKVIVSPQVSQRLGELCKSRSVLLKVLNRLYHQLGEQAVRYRGQRDYNDPDLFIYRHSLYTADRGWLTFEFAVNDARAQDHLFVESVTSRP